MGNLFDRDLLEQDPSLNRLEASASSASVDAAGRVLLGVTASAGVRFERDELLGQGSSGWIVRFGGASRLPLSWRFGATYERTVSGDIGRAGPGISRLGVAREWSAGRWEGTLAVGGEFGGLWRYTRLYRAAAATGSVTLARTLTLGGSVATQRDLYAKSGWRPRSSAFVGVALSPFLLQLRVSPEPGEAGSVLAAAVAVKFGSHSVEAR